MKRIVIRDGTIIPPFGEPARDLRILNKPLWVLQRDLLSRHCRGALEVESPDDIPRSAEELLVHRDNLFFNQNLIDTFVAAARASGHACQLAFSVADKAITSHALPLQDGIRLHSRGDVYIADLFYYPHGAGEEPQPLVVDTDPREMGYYRIPSYMAPNHGDLVYQVPLRAFLSIENWVHVFLANSPFGVFALGRAQEQLAEESWREKLAIWFSTVGNRLNPLSPPWRNHMFSSSRMVKVGKNCSIDPTATIHGPTIIGDDVTIGAGVVITNSIIGNNVNIMQGSQVMLSVVSDRCYLPWNAALFMTTLMENTMVAQLSCLQMCVVGRNTFIGAGNIFTDFNLTGRPLRTLHNGELREVNMPVLGSAVGHNCKIGSKFVFYPGRMIGSGTTLIYSEPSTVISSNVNLAFEEDAPKFNDTGDVQRTVYVWPHRYYSGQEQPSDAEHEAPSLNGYLDEYLVHHEEQVGGGSPIDAMEMSLPAHVRVANRRTPR